jgi:hypothetical protein
MNILKSLTIPLLSLVVLTSCDKEPALKQIHSDLSMLEDWQEFEIGDNEELIFKITITSENKIDLSWKEEPWMKDGDSFTADIMISAYRPDGGSSYFENEDNGFQDDSKMIDIIEGDLQVILIIKARDGKSGTFALRARGISETLVTNPKDLAFGTNWIDKKCGVGDIKWLKVDCGLEKDIIVEWMEFDRPELGSNYAADIKVSVYSEDLDVTYFLDKNHNYSDRADPILLTHSSSIIYIRVTLNDDTKFDTYAIRAYAQ